jgi:hypothetical protein
MLEFNFEFDTLDNFRQLIFILQLPPNWRSSSVRAFG